MLSAARPAKVGKWNEPALRVLRERYLTRRGDEVIEAPEDMCWRVAVCLARAEERWGKSLGAVQEIAQAFYELMVDGFFLPNSPTLMNAGKENGLQYSACYVLPVGDSMDEIFDAVKAAAIIHKSGGGCISGDARVWTTFCGLEPIEVLVNRAIADGRAGERNGAGVAFDVSDLDIHTVSMNPRTGQAGLRRVTHVWRFDVPAELQLLVETHEGTQIQTSAWHPFMVVRPQGLVAVRADELTPGDVILGPDRPDDYWPYRSYQRAGSLLVDERLGWLVGFTLGDGSFGYVPALRQYRLRWFSGARDVLEKVRAILGEHGIHVTIQKDARGLLSVATLTQRFVLDMLEACGLEKIGAKDERVRVPEIIAKSPLPVVRAFVAGLVDSDGYVAGDGSPSYATVSKEMAEDLAGLMGLLAYQPSVKMKPPHGRGRRVVYEVQLCTLPQVNDLRTDVAPHMASEHKLGRLSSRSRKQTALQLPFRPWRDRLKRLGLVGSRGSGVGPGPCSAELSRWSCNQYGRCRRDDLLAIADTVAAHDADLAGVLRAIAKRGLEVGAVRRAPEPKAFYDLSVEEWNTYAAGIHGMAFVHNTGFAFSRLRPKDDLVSSTGGKASGPVSFLRVFNGATEAVKQGGTRRGANMGILRVDHPDILEFIECKLDGGITNFNISVAATDRFMEALARGEEYELINPRSGQVTGKLSAREVFERIVRAAWRTGDPGMVFIDRINRSPANPTPEVGMVEATNPCITGEALIYTARGLIRTDALAKSGEAVDVTLDSRFDVGEWGPASTVFQTGVKPVYRLVTEEGYELRLTADHRVMTPEGWRQANSLGPGDLIHILNRKGGFGTEGTLEEGRLLGWLIGDGHIRPDKGVILRFYGEEKRELAPLFAGHMNAVVGTGEGDRYRVTAVEVTGRDQATVISVRFARRVLERYHLSQETKLDGVPPEILAGSEDLQRGFLQALFTADGHISGRPEKGVSVRLTSISLPLLRDIQRMLLNFGIVSRLYANRHLARMVSLPDGKGGTAEYECQPDHDLVISRACLLTFAREVGFLTEAKQNRLLQAMAAYSRGPYRETFVARFKALEPDGVEPVYDLKEPLTHSFISNGFVVHNCGEQPLLPNEACNLGSINVSKFARRAPNGEWTIDWQELERVVRLSVRFLDDVIEMNPYPLPEIDATVKANRRIGLGVMGWADLLFIMGIPYDSQEALDLADQLMAFIGEKGHDQSAKLAEERGPFPNWSRSIYKNDRPLRNSTVTTIAPTGCVTPDTRIATADGLLTIRQLGDPAGEKWQPIEAMVFTDTGMKAATQFYVNGRSPVITVKTAHGYSLTATPNHKIRVVDSNGEYAWRRIDAIQIGDYVAIQRGFLPDHAVVFLEDEPPIHGNEKPISLPDRLTPELCEFLGIYFGDGCTKEKGIRITFDERDLDTAEHVRVLVKSLFNMEAGAAEQYRGRFALTFHSTRLVKWLARNSLLKPQSSEIRVPEAIFRADRECVKAFLRGLFTADGAVSREQGTVTVASVSEAFIDAVQLLLLGVGVVSKKDVSTNRTSAKGDLPLHRLTVLGRNAFAEISFLPGRKRDRFKALSADRELMFRIPHAAALISEIYSRIPQGRAKASLKQAKHRGLLTMKLLHKVASEHPEALKGSKLERFVERSQFYDQVAGLFFGEANTLDLSVPDTNTYIANGFVSHNTISMIAGCSSGIEPIFALAFEHRVKQPDGERVLTFVNETFERIAREHGFYSEGLMQEVVRRGALQGIAGVPEWAQRVFKTAHEIPYEWHVRHQGAFQKHTDNGVSKTINLPRSATTEDIARAYLLAWDLGCLGITVFRDGCKGDQVLHAGVKGKKEEPAAAVKGPAIIKPRPHSLAGHTYRMETPIGTAYITVNDNGHGEPFEVFVSVGKAGSDTMAVAEALGRLISLTLRLPSPFSPKRRLEEIIGQLSRIGGGQPTGFGPSKVLSLPDALARVLAEHIGEAKPPEMEATSNGPKRIGDLCKECGQATFVYEEGCKKCLSCGYNEC